MIVFTSDSIAQCCHSSSDNIAPYDDALYRDLLASQCRKHGVAVFCLLADAQPHSSHSRPRPRRGVQARALVAAVDDRGRRAQRARPTNSCRPRSGFHSRSTPTSRRAGGLVLCALAARRPSRTAASQSLILPLIRVRSKAELAVRAEAHELESLALGFAIDEHEIRPNMAVTKVFPPAGERMIVKTRRQRLVGGQHGDHFAEQVLQLSAVTAGLRPPVIPLVSADSSNRPH